MFCFFLNKNAKQYRGHLHLGLPPAEGVEHVEEHHGHVDEDDQAEEWVADDGKGAVRVPGDVPAPGAVAIAVAVQSLCKIKISCCSC